MHLLSSSEEVLLHLNLPTQSSAWAYDGAEDTQWYTSVSLLCISLPPFPFKKQVNELQLNLDNKQNLRIWLLYVYYIDLFKHYVTH